jgi:hypothetical protein
MVVSPGAEIGVEFELCADRLGLARRTAGGVPVCHCFTKGPAFAVGDEGAHEGVERECPADLSLKVVAKYLATALPCWDDGLVRDRGAQLPA